MTSEAFSRLRPIERAICGFIAVCVVTSSANAFALVGPSAASKQRAFTAKVSSVVDGDTIRVVDERGVPLTIRVEGIDCPESGQPYGGVARRFTRAQVFDRSVQVHVVDKDQHGRIIARIFIDRSDLSIRLLQAGLAWHYTDYSHDPVLAAVEQEARNARRGL